MANRRGGRIAERRGDRMADRLGSPMDDPGEPAKRRAFPASENASIPACA